MLRLDTKKKRYCTNCHHIEAAHCGDIQLVEPGSCIVGMNTDTPCTCREFVPEGSLSETPTAGEAPARKDVPNSNTRPRVAVGRSEHSKQPRLNNLDRMVNRLLTGWGQYVAVFGEAPHGTKKQIEALIILSGLSKGR